MFINQIKLSYLYRDGANYKNYHDVYFTNKESLALVVINETIRRNLIEELWFIANKWEIPDLHFEKWNQDIDHDYHEFLSVEYSNCNENTIDDISYFLAKFNS